MSSADISKLYSQPHYEGGAPHRPTLQLRQTRPREAELLAHNHTAGLIVVVKPIGVIPGGLRYHIALRLSAAEGGNRQNRLPLETGLHRGPDCGLLSYMPSIYGNDIPTGKPGPWKEEPQGSYLDSPSLKEYPNYLCNRIESYILLCLLGYDHRPINNCPVNYLGLRRMNQG